MFRPDGDRRSFSVTRDMTVIGRREDCDLRIPLGDISRKHCRLVRDGDVLKIEDLGSSNGTYLNAHRVQEALLSPGDSIQVGPVVFVLQIDGEPADDELSPISLPIQADASRAKSGDASDSGILEPIEADDLEELEDELSESKKRSAAESKGGEAVA
jgi:pSer/pThr/pTyr-binding forkhead associated (FHA) protein